MASSSSDSSASVSKSSSVVSLPDAGNTSSSATHAELAREAEHGNDHPEPKTARLEDEKGGFKFTDEPTLERLRSIQSEFIDERNWHQWQTPRNILLALVGEVGELSEIFQWKGEVPLGLPGWSEQEKDHLGQEMSDVLIYLIRLADVCKIDLTAAAMNKIEMNRRKYPAEKFYGSSRKYNKQ